MKKKMQGFIVLWMILTLLPTTAYAGDLTFGQIQDELASAQKELRENQAAINDKKDQITEDNATIQSLKEDIEKMSQEVVVLQQEIVRANEEIGAKKEQTKDLISYYQMSQGENLYLDYIFGGESITDLVYRMSIVDQISEYNDQMVNDLEDLIESNENRKIVLANKQEEYEDKMANLEEEISKLNSSIEKMNGLSPSLEEQVKAKEELVKFYKEQGCKNRGDVIGRDCAVSSSNSTFRRPFQTGYVTSFTGIRWGSLHRGIDLGSPQGKNTPLYSIGNGVITNVYHDSNGALCLIIQYRTSDGKYYSALYAHLSRYAPGIYVGMKPKEVTVNTLVGYMGDTGYAFGVHLHLEVYPCRIYVDKECSTWNKYVSFASQMFNQGYKGSESVINFPSRTYQTWYAR